MNHRPLQQKRILAIDPTTRGFGFAILEGPTRLIDWGVKEAREDKHHGCRTQVAALIERYQPDVLVVEDGTGKGSRRCLRVQALIREILNLASEQKINTRAVTRSQIGKAFATYGAYTKHQIASVIAERLPELTPRLPPLRKPWMSEDDQMAIFDAIAFALTYFSVHNKRERPACS